MPIDNPLPIALLVAPTSSAQDVVESVTLKSFRKVIGYDTFNSILKKSRDEMKDPADHYNITVSLMVRREPQPRTGKAAFDAYNPGLSKLSQTLDKGFPYDDADNSIDIQAPSFRKRDQSESVMVG